MNTAYLITILAKPAKDLPRGSIGDAYPVFRFVTSLPEGRANYLAGRCMDGLADYHGTEFDYRVEPLPYVDGLTADYEIARLALEKGAV